jgi:hypothetical protein
MDVEADNPLEAAQRAQAAFMREGSIAHVFSVMELDLWKPYQQTEPVTIDLDYPDGIPHEEED